MIVEINKNEMHIIAPLFAGWDETVVWSCLQGCMGRAWAAAPSETLCKTAPSAGQIVVADLFFYAGDACSPNAAAPSDTLEILCNIPSDYSKPHAYMTPKDDTWHALIEDTYKGNYKKNTRYAIKKEPDVFDRELLQQYVYKLPEQYCIVPIDEPIYHWTKTEEWANDFCSQFSTYDDYQKHGIGFVVLHAGKPVCGASSITYYDKGIEIQIETVPEHRRRGLATVCAAQLILRCLDKGLYPSWDAANRESVALAEKLGYNFDREYIAYDISIKR